MQNANGQPKNTLSERLLGEATPAKASGAAFSLAAVLPAVLSMLVVLVFAATGLSSREGFYESDLYIYASYLLSPIAFALVALWYLRYTKTGVKQAVAAQKCRPRYILAAVLLQVGLLSLSELNAWFLSFLERFGYTDSGILLPSLDGFGFVGAILAIAVLPAVFEELIFRGVLLDGLHSFGEAGAALVCGALFALYHQNPAQTLYQFCCGVAFALVALRSGSILPTVVSHFLNNAFILTLEKCGVYEFASPAKWIILGVSVVCLALSFVWLLTDKNKEKRESDKSERKRFFVCAAAGVAVCGLTWLITLFTGF